MWEQLLALLSNNSAIAALAALGALLSALGALITAFATWLLWRATVRMGEATENMKQAAIGQAAVSILQMYNSNNYLIMQDDDMLKAFNLLFKDEKFEKILNENINASRSVKEKVEWLSSILLNIQKAAFSLGSLIPEYNNLKNISALSQMLDHKHVRYLVCNSGYSKDFVDHCKCLYKKGGKTWDF